MIKLFVLFFAIYLGSASAQASNQCAKIYSQRQENRSALAQHIHLYRQSEIKETDIELINVNGTNFQVKGILGEGTSKVYLAEGAKGNLVSIKVIEDDSVSHWVNSIYYEIAATKFYQEMGLPVTKIYDYQVAYSAQLETVVGVLVKEYREGITREELEQLAAAKSAEWSEGEKLLARLAAYRSRLKKIHKGFRAWLTVNNIKLKPFKKLESLIEESDIADQQDNLLFDPKVGKWIIFDP